MISFSGGLRVKTRPLRVTSYLVRSFCAGAVNIAFAALNSFPAFNKAGFIARERQLVGPTTDNSRLRRKAVDTNVFCKVKAFSQFEYTWLRTKYTRNEQEQHCRCHYFFSALKSRHVMSDFDEEP